MARYGALVVRDSRVTEEDNEKFLDLLEDYFALPNEELKRDERPEFGYQVGVTLENTEKPKCKVFGLTVSILKNLTGFLLFAQSDDNCLKIIEKLDPAERPLDILAHGAGKCLSFCL